jgi:hypothetical protein
MVYRTVQPSLRDSDRFPPNPALKRWAIITASLRDSNMAPDTLGHLKLGSLAAGFMFHEHLPSKELASRAIKSFLYSRGELRDCLDGFGRAPLQEQVGSVEEDCFRSGI